MNETGKKLENRNQKCCLSQHLVNNLCYMPTLYVFDLNCSPQSVFGLGGLMRPAGTMKAHMRPATQFEFETPAIKNHCCKKQNNLSFNGFDAGYSNS
jgi:hypothetical protein